MVTNVQARNKSVFGAVADPTRRAILDLLKAGELPAGELARQFPVSRPAVSRHIRILKDAGLVRESRTHNRAAIPSVRSPWRSSINGWRATACSGPPGFTTSSDTSKTRNERRRLSDDRSVDPYLHLPTDRVPGSGVLRADRPRPAPPVVCGTRRDRTAARRRLPLLGSAYVRRPRSNGREPADHSAGTRPRAGVQLADGRRGQRGDARARPARQGPGHRRHPHEPVAAPLL